MRRPLASSPNISLRLGGRKLRWDADKEDFVDGPGSHSHARSAVHPPLGQGTAQSQVWSISSWLSEVRVEQRAGSSRYKKRPRGSQKRIRLERGSDDRAEWAVVPRGSQFFARSA